MEVEWAERGDRRALTRASLNSEPKELALLWGLRRVNFCFLAGDLVKISLFLSLYYIGVDLSTLSLYTLHQ